MLHVSRNLGHSHNADEHPGDNCGGVSCQAGEESSSSDEEEDEGEEAGSPGHREGEEEDSSSEESSSEDEEEEEEEEDESEEEDDDTVNEVCSAHTGLVVTARLPPIRRCHNLSCAGTALRLDN